MFFGGISKYLVESIVVYNVFKSDSEIFDFHAINLKPNQLGMQEVLLPLVVLGLLEHCGS